MQPKKTILIFIDWYLPGFKAGGPIQSCANLVSHLKDEFNFRIITRDTDYCETTPYAQIISNTWHKADEDTQIYYLSTERINRQQIQRLINETKHDMVYLNGMFSYYFTIVPLWYLRKNKAKPIIVAARGMLAPGALAIKGLKKKIFLTAAKALKLFSHVTFHATGAAEKKDIQQLFGAQCKVLVAGNLPKKAILPPFHPRHKLTGQIKLVNIARVAPEKNLKYALEILKEVKSQVVFDFYGPVYNNAYYEECLNVIKSLPSNVLATYREVLPNNMVANTLKDYDAMLMPTLGENFGHIILESLCASCPVIISDQTPWQFSANDHAGIAIALNNKQGFIDAVETLAAASTEMHNQRCLAAYQKGKSFIENEEILAANKALFLES